MTTVSQPSPTTLTSCLACSARSLSFWSILGVFSCTLAPFGGVKVKRSAGCWVNSMSLNATSSAGVDVPLLSTDTRSGIRVCESTATRISRSSVRSVGFGVRTSSYAGRPATVAVPSTDTVLLSRTFASSSVEAVSGSGIFSLPAPFCLATSAGTVTLVAVFVLEL